MVTLQGLINISMVLGLLPTKGIALPFISQGGSSLLMNLAAIGILLNLSHQNKVAEAVE
jgi:cell division protein FtsW